MINKKIARRYTTALFDIASEKNKLDDLQDDLQLISDSIEGSRELRNFLKSPVINSYKKRTVLLEIFKNKVGEDAVRLLTILTGKHRESSLYDICKDFTELINERKGVTEAEIVTAIELTDNEKKNLIETLKTHTGKNLIPVFNIDKSIKGGFIARIGDTVIDASIKHQLGVLLEEFKKGSAQLN